MNRQTQNDLVAVAWFVFFASFCAIIIYGNKKCPQENRSACIPFADPAVAEPKIDKPALKKSKWI